MFCPGKIHWSGTRCHSFHFVLAAMLAWSATFALAGPDLELLSGQPELSVMVLPAIDGNGDDDSGQAQGPQIAVRWSGELPVRLQSGVEDADGRWQARGEPVELIVSMSLLPAPENAAGKIFRIMNDAGTVLASARGEAETFGWTPTFAGPGPDDRVYATTVYDGDLIVGGNFLTIGEKVVNRIARWDGSEWSSLSGPNGNGLNGWVRTLTVHNGDLIAGGGFTRADGEMVNYIARWDGSEWSALSGPNGTGMNDWVYALTVHNGDLIAGGAFAEAGGETVNYIARWDGSDWSALSGPNGTGMDDAIRALIVHNEDLIAGGFFTEAGGETVNYIARWDGSDWSAFSSTNGIGVDNAVRALSADNGSLIAGGDFAEAGGEAVNYIARWDGNGWSGLSGPNGTGMNERVMTLTVHNDDLIAGGWFTLAGGVAARRMARWQLQATITELVFAEYEAVDPGEPVLVTARVRGQVSTPDEGLRGRIEADTGEFCEAPVTAESGTTATFSCEITLDHPGTRTLTAHYTGSARYHPSQSAAVPMEVNEDIFQDRFESR